jgi:hypothetical protein
MNVISNAHNWVVSLEENDVLTKPTIVFVDDEGEDPSVSIIKSIKPGATRVLKLLAAFVVANVDMHVIHTLDSVHTMAGKVSKVSDWMSYRNFLTKENVDARYDIERHAPLLPSGGLCAICSQGTNNA